MRDLSSQKWKHLTNNPHNNLFVVIENNYKTKLQNKTTTKWLVFSFNWKVQKMKKTKSILKIKRLPGCHSNVQFLGRISISTQALFHSCLPFLNFVN